MDREKAVEVIKQVFARCNSLEGKSLTLMPPRPGREGYSGYQIFIQTRDDYALEMCLEVIATENKLAFEKKGDLFKIYEP